MQEKEKIEMAYKAGVMDGDGSFSLIKKTDQKNPLYFPFIQLSNQNEKLVKSFNSDFGGYLHLRKPWIGKDNSIRQASWQWRIEKQQSRMFLETIIPYLKVKKERAQFLLNFMNDNEFKRGINLTDDVLQKREKAYLKMLNFNNVKFINKKIISKRNKKPTENQEFWAYVSGLIDTDGSFSIKRETKNVYKSFKYLPIISLSMTDIDGLNYIIKYCPYGNVRQYKDKNCRYGFTYRFSIHDHKDCIKFVEYCLPYLKVKKKQALIMLNFCKNRKVINYRMKGLFKEELQFRDNCYQAMINANKYGVIKSPLIDLELPQRDNKAEDESHRERLNKGTS